MSKRYENERIKSKQVADALNGSVYWSPKKSIWVSSMYLVAIIGGYYTFTFEALAVFIVFTSLTLCFGHSLGMHRRLIHKSYECPKWLEYLCVHLGVLVGLAGPKRMMQTHDLRDWAQRQQQSHDYFGHQSGLLKDWYWQLHCDIDLTDAPEFKPEASFQNDPIYHWMEKTWMWQQLPWAIILFLAGDVSWVIWGIAVRVAVSVTGHWLIGYFAHNHGGSHWNVEGASVQGYNIKFCALITMGESYHNNHHAFPGSAKLALKEGELDVGWLVLKGLERLGLVWDLKTPETLPERPELKHLEN